MPRYVYLFSDIDRAQEAVGGEWPAVRRLLGGKGANLADMTRSPHALPPLDSFVRGEHFGTVMIHT